MTGTSSPGTPPSGWSPQWQAWREATDLAEYEARFAHDAAHGEADLVAWFGATSVLDAGCGTGRVAVELHRRGIEVVGVDLDDEMLAYARAKAPTVRWEHADLATMQLSRRFHVVALPGNVLLYCRTADRVAVVRSCAEHLQSGGLLVAGFAVRTTTDAFTLDSYDAACDGCGLVLEHRWATWDRQPYVGGDYAVSVHRRPARDG